MNEQHPITPPPELMRQWSRFQGDTNPEALWFRIANEAARWGADQELEACCALMELSDSNARDFLQSARRSKPPSLKEQALEALAHILNNSSTQLGADTIRRALEQLDD
jgi:hypothetical protein